MTLNDLALKYGSDKGNAEHGHNYCPFYEQTLPKNPKRLLEIGCLHGASARMWREWFPDTEVHILDLFQENPIPDIEGVVFHKGDQRDWLLLEELRKLDFDVIIDDGGHLSRAQMMTFYGLFNSKHYYIEDLQCCAENFYREELPEEVTAKDLLTLSYLIGGQITGTSTKTIINWGHNALHKSKIGLIYASQLP